MKQYVYTSTKDNRIRQIIVDDNGKHTSKSYPRVVMEEYLGRPLKDNEDVHHIERGYSNFIQRLEALNADVNIIQ